MSGLERIIQTIEDDAAARCTAIEQEARQRADQIIADGRTQARQEADALLEDARQRLEVQRSNAMSAARLAQRNRLLQEKQRLMDQAEQQAKQALRDLPRDQYFAALLSLASHYARDGEGELRLSQGDLARLPADFEQRLNAALPRGRVQVSSAPAPIEDGFLLVYGDVEENCTVDALFEAQRDALRDTLHAMLFEGLAHEPI